MAPTINDGDTRRWRAPRKSRRRRPDFALPPATRHAAASHSRLVSATTAPRTRPRARQHTRREEDLGRQRSLGRLLRHGRALQTRRPRPDAAGSAGPPAGSPRGAVAALGAVVRSDERVELRHRVVEVGVTSRARLPFAKPHL